MTSTYSMASVASNVARRYEGLIKENYGEDWEIDFNRDFQWTAKDYTVPFKPEDHGVFENLTTLVAFLRSTFPKAFSL